MKCANFLHIPYPTFIPLLVMYYNLSNRDVSIEDTEIFLLTYSYITLLIWDLYFRVWYSNSTDLTLYFTDLALCLTDLALYLTDFNLKSVKYSLYLIDLYLEIFLSI